MFFRAAAAIECFSNQVQYSTEKSTSENKTFHLIMD